MDKLSTEFTRLYALPDQPVQAVSHADGSTGYCLTTPDGPGRCLRLRFPRPADWPLASTLWQQLAERWELPAPAISVSPTAGFELWLSLAAPLPRGEARRLGEWLLTALPAENRGSAVVVEAGASLFLPPALDPVSGKWSAFIDPTLGGMFAEEPGLDFPPQAERQAEMLAALGSISVPQLDQLRQEWEGQEGAASPSADLSPPRQRYTDPRAFLLAVMNDEAVALPERIRAAEALLAHQH